MTPPSSLDHSGKLSANPFAEVLAEISHAGLDGSLRVSSGERKCIVYLRDGVVSFAVSNAREHRLLNMLVEQKLVDMPALAGLPKCSNDVELASAIAGLGILQKEVVDGVVISQIERILIDILSWTDGEWQFSPLVRSRADLVYPIDTRKLLIGFARCRPMSAVMGRFKSVQELFEKVENTEPASALQAHELHVLNCFGDSPRSIEDLTFECGLPENGFLHSIYVLWLAGLIRRKEWNAAFSPQRIAAIRNARLELVKRAQSAAPIAGEQVTEEVPAETPAEAPVEPVKPEVQEISLEEFLARAEESDTHYDVLGVDQWAKIAEIKTAYFALAKRFHPDRYHREAAETLQRIQTAFSKVQAAYETLKANDARENYDFKMRKELEMKAKLKAQGINTEESSVNNAKAEQGLESFEVGLSLLMDEEYDRAIPFLGRAAHYNPENALYRAYYGKALSYDDKQRHKAEGEMQAAIKIDPRNPKTRMMLVEFLMERNQLKRAEGELKRFLEIVPGNADAQHLLSKLQAAAPA